MTLKKTFLIVIGALVAGAFLYLAVYQIASNSEAFKFIDQQLRNSLDFNADIGEIRDVQLDPFGPYDSKIVGADETVSMVVNVKGSKKNITLAVKVKKLDGIWGVAEIRDRPE